MHLTRREWGLVFISTFIVGPLILSIAIDKQGLVDLSESIESAYIIAANSHRSLPETDNQELEIQALKEEIQMLTREVQELRKEVQKIAFHPMDIPVPEDYQRLIHSLSREYGVDKMIVLSIWKVESGWAVNPPDNYNTNGSIDRGPMQINSVNWGWLAAEGLDINNPEECIEAGVLMYSRLVEKYGEYWALAAYNCGESGMEYGSYYADKVIGGFEI